MEHVDKNVGVFTEQKKFLLMRRTLANFIRDFATGRHTDNPWWYLLVEDENMKLDWESLSRRVLMMAEKDSLALLEMCGLVALKKDELGSIVGVRAVKELAIHAFIDEFVLSDVMAISITKAPKDKKARYFVYTGGNKNRVSVTVQGNMSGRRAPRVCRPTLREDLMRIFVACNCVTAPSIKTGMSESDIYELKAKIE